MARVAVFVDAGYFYARSAEALAGRTLARRMLDLDEVRLVEELRAFAETKAGAAGSLLRIYWYDGAAVSGLSPEQIRIADVDDVKVRLGVINTFGQQKGVDSLIVIDLIDLARNHAIDSAVLLSGDEDIRVAVTVTQTYGVRVHLLGIATAHGTAQSRALVREVDTKSSWDADTLSQFIRMREAEPVVLAIAPLGGNGEAPEHHAPAVDAAANVAAVPAARGGGDPPEDTPEAQTLIEERVAEFLATLTAADRDDILLVYDRERRLPIYHDRRLLASVGRAFQRPLSIDERREMRTSALALLRASRGEPPLDV